MSNAAAARRMEESGVLKLHPATDETSAPSNHASPQTGKSRLDRACDFALELVRRHRAMEADYDQTLLNEHARNECIRLLKSEDPEERWRGMRFYLRVLALQVKMEGQELDLMKKAIETLVIKPRSETR